MMEKVDVGKVISYIFGSTLGITGSIIIIPLKILAIDAIEKAVGRIPGTAGWVILAGADGLLAVIATDKGLKEEGTLAKGVLLGFGTTEAFATFWDLVFASLAAKGKRTGEIATEISKIAERAEKVVVESSGSSNPKLGRLL